MSKTKNSNKKQKSRRPVNWPTTDEFWTIKDLLKINSDFIAITLRVRLFNAIHKQNLVAVIGDKKNPKGRPEMVCAMRQKDGTVKPEVIKAAKAAGIFCGPSDRPENNPTCVVPVMDVSQKSKEDNGNGTVVVHNPTSKVVSA